VTGLIDGEMGVCAIDDGLTLHFRNTYAQALNLWILSLLSFSSDIARLADHYKKRYNPKGIVPQ
jgi:hypothetical protein